MSTNLSPGSTPTTTAMPTPKEQFLSSYANEHERTMRVLRAYPPDRLDLQPHPRSRTARELAWLFVLERGLGTVVFNNQFPQGMPTASPPPPESWDELLATLERAHADFAELVRQTPDAAMFEKVRFLTGPKTIGEVSRIEWVWFLLCDEIHHRGQFSVYLRMAGAAVPSIYGPTADEPWM